MLNRNGVALARPPAAIATLALSLAIAGCAPAARTQPQQAPKPPAQATQKPAPGAAAAPTEPAAKPVMTATSPDGTKIAYEVAGTGPALLLVHGGGQTRRSWNQSGYVDRLSKRFTVITIDMRGSGDSDKPVAKDAYALDKVLADLIAVADAVRATRFHLWGFGQGATIARYLAARSDRVISTVLVGATLGPAVTGIFKDAITGMRAKWQPLIDAYAAGTLDVKTLSPSDRAAWDGGVASSVLALGALLDYPPLEPAEIKAPTLWLVGSEDGAAGAVKGYEGKLSGTRVTLKLLGSVNYSDSFVRIDQIMAEVDPFLAKAGSS